MSKYPIVGFLNRGVLFPNFVATIVDMQGSYGAKAGAPGAELTNIPGVVNEEGLLRCPKFWKDTSDRQLDISRDEFAFAFSSEQFVIGTAEELIHEIQKQYVAKVLPSEILCELEWIIQELKKNPALSCYFA